jgi:antitoxin YefM
LEDNADRQDSQSKNISVFGRIDCIIGYKKYSHPTFVNMIVIYLSERYKLVCQKSIMPVISANDARANLYQLIDETASSHEPILITGKQNNAVLVSEDDWRSIQETLYLLSIPNMRESIKEGMNTPIEKCSKELDW